MKGPSCVEVESRMPLPISIQRVVVLQIWTTADDHGVCVSKENAETIEIGWILLDASTLEEVVTVCLGSLDLIYRTG